MHYKKAIAVFFLILIPAFYIGYLAENSQDRNYPLGYVLSKEKNILILKYPDSILMNNIISGILPPGAKYHFVLPSDVEKLDLMKYDLILIPSHFFDFEYKYNPSFMSKIHDYVEDGGSLIVLLQYNYDWLATPVKFEKRTVTSVTTEDLNHSFFDKMKHTFIPDMHVIQSIKKLRASQARDGFIYPAYGVFSNYSGNGLILDSATQKPVIINMSAGDGKIFLIASSWDYHFYRTDIPDSFANEEAILYYYAILWALDSDKPLIAYQIFPIGMQMVLIPFLFSLIISSLFESNKELIKYSIFFILIIGIFASIFMGLLYSEMNTYYDKVYLMDKNFDGFPDQSNNIIDMDGLVSDFGKAQKYHYLYSIFFYLSIISLPFGAILHLTKNWFEEYKWGGQIIFTIVFMLLILFTGFFVAILI